MEPYPTPLEVLEQLKEEKASLFDCLELLYKPLSKLDSTLGVVTRYLIDELGYTEKEAEKEINEVLKQWL